MASTDSPLAHAETCRRHWSLEDDEAWPAAPESPARGRADSDDQTYSAATLRESREDRSDDDQTVAPPRTPMTPMGDCSPDDGASDVSDLSN